MPILPGDACAKAGGAIAAISPRHKANVSLICFLSIELFLVSNQGFFLVAGAVVRGAGVVELLLTSATRFSALYASTNALVTTLSGLAHKTGLCCAEASSRSA